MEQKTELFQIDHLKKHYLLKHTGKQQGGLLKAVDDVSFSIGKGEVLGVVGESGCGKSTLGRCLIKLIEATEGEILFKGTSLRPLSQREMKPYRKDMQMIFQNPYSSFNPKQTIGRALTDVGRFYGMTPEALKEKIRELLRYVNLDEDVLARRSNELSGGQLQRLAIIRALLPDPDFIVADEPVSALDVSVQAQILNLMLDINREFGLTLLFISHDLTVIEHVCDRVLVMYLGSVVEIGETEELFQNTQHPYTKALIASKPKDHPDDPEREVLLTGEVPNATQVPTGCRFHPRCPIMEKGLCDVTPPELRDVGNDHSVACHLAGREKDGAVQ